MFLLNWAGVIYTQYELILHLAHLNSLLEGAITEMFLPTLIYVGHRRKECHMGQSGLAEKQTIPIIPLPAD